MTNITKQNIQYCLTGVDKRYHRKGLRGYLRKIAGFNAIELSLVLAVIAIAIVATIRVMGGNSDKQSSNQMVNDVSTMQSDIKSAYQSSTSGYNTLSTQSAIDAQLIPKDLRINNSTIQSQFQGGTVEIAAGTNGENFTITYKAVPKSICNSAINTLGQSTFISISVNGQDVYNSSTPLDAANVAAKCKTTDTATVVFTAS